MNQHPDHQCWSTEGRPMVRVPFWTQIRPRLNRGCWERLGARLIGDLPWGSDTRHTTSKTASMCCSGVPITLYLCDIGVMDFPTLRRRCLKRLLQTKNRHVRAPARSVAARGECPASGACGQAIKPRWRPPCSRVGRCRNGVRRRLCRVDRPCSYAIRRRTSEPPTSRRV
jgi:hypothetical protein